MPSALTLISNIGPSAHDTPAVECIRRYGGGDDRGKSTSQNQAIVLKENRCTLCQTCQSAAPRPAKTSHRTKTDPELKALRSGRCHSPTSACSIEHLNAGARTGQPNAGWESAFKPLGGNFVRHIPTRRFAAVDGRRAAGSAVAISAECHCNSATPWRKPLQIRANPCLISDLGRAPRRADSYR